MNNTNTADTTYTTDTAAEAFNVQAHQVSDKQRRYAKVINFGLIYDMQTLISSRKTI